MSNRLEKLLLEWQQNKDDLHWVLATIIQTEGSSYRKSGAMMMINSLGRYIGMLSGGCLESDIMRQSRRCWDTGENRIVEYDMREEEDLAWKLGIGCGGMVKILLQPVSLANDYLMLPELLKLISQQKTCIYRQHLDSQIPANKIVEQTNDKVHDIAKTASPRYIDHIISPPPHLLVMGAGLDVIPLISFANILGWRITLSDPRQHYGREHGFKTVSSRMHDTYSSEHYKLILSNVDAIIIMHHSLKLDAQALKLAQTSSAKYVGLLGPQHRTDRVLQQVDMTTKDLSLPLANPAGIRLGGELPESIALSIISQIHKVLEGADGKDISFYQQ
ncbi:XdhC family protein [Agaribacter flavus]|uniref:XdhC family protein n=1 Tax=Agaribacter flavus TaxID=1902781 RepID=A0ABV7FR14_9ALTE